MAARIHLISDIVAGKVNWRLEVRVIRLWTLPEYNNPLAVNSIEMILLDENVILYSSLTIIFYSYFRILSENVFLAFSLEGSTVL